MFMTALHRNHQAPQSHVLTDQVGPDRGGHGEVADKCAHCAPGGCSQGHRPLVPVVPRWPQIWRRHN